MHRVLKKNSKRAASPGKGCVFYSALGHDPAEFDSYPQVFQMSMNGILWGGNAL